MPICMFYSLLLVIFFYLDVSMLLRLPLTGGHCLINMAKLSLFLSYKYYTYFSIEMDLFICLGVCYSQRMLFVDFDTCKVGYIEHDYATVAGMLGIE